MSVRFKLPPGGDVPPVTAARRMGLTLEDLEEALPELLARDFPAPDPTTGNFHLEAIEKWLLIDARSVYSRIRAQGFNTKPDVLKHGYVYFVRGAGLIKIGRTIDPFDRLKALQLGSPIALSIEAIAPGNGGLEGTLHNFFKEERRHGEWFEASPRLEAYIIRVREMGFAPDVGHSEAGDLILPLQEEDATK